MKVDPEWCRADEVGAAIAEARRRAGLTQVKAAERVGTSQPELCAMESGRRNPTVAMLGRIAKAYGLKLRIGFTD